MSGPYAFRQSRSVSVFLQSAVIYRLSESTVTIKHYISGTFICQAGIAKKSRISAHFYQHALSRSDQTSIFPIMCVSFQNCIASCSRRMRSLIHSRAENTTVSLCFVLLSIFRLFITDFRQNQPAGGRCGTCRRPFPRPKDLHHPFRFHTAIPGFHQCSHNNPHHIVQKSAARHTDHDLFSLFLHGQIIDRSDGGLRLASCAAETGKVMFPHQIRRCPPHLLHVKRHISEMGVQPFHRIRKSGIPDMILVGLSARAVPWVKILRHLLLQTNKL